MQGGRASAGMVLTKFSWNVPVSAPDGLKHGVVIPLIERGNWFELVSPFPSVHPSVCPSVHLSVCGQNPVCCVSSTILVGSISY